MGKYFRSIASAFLLMSSSALTQEVEYMGQPLNINSADNTTINNPESNDSPFYASLGFSPRWGLKKAPVATPSQGVIEALSYKGNQGSVAVGAFITDSLKVEVEGLINKIDVKKVSEKAALNISAVMLNAYFNVPINAKIAAYVGGGAGVAREGVKDLNKLVSASQDPSSLTLLAAQGKIGMLYNISDKIQVYGGGRIFGVLPNKGFSLTTSGENYQKTIDEIKNILKPRVDKGGTDTKGAITNILDTRSVTHLKQKDLSQSPISDYLKAVYKSTDFAHVQPEDTLSGYNSKIDSDNGFQTIKGDFDDTLTKSNALGNALYILYQHTEDDICSATIIKSGLNNLMETESKLSNTLTNYNPPSGNTQWNLYLPFISYGPEVGVVINFG